MREYFKLLMLGVLFMGVTACTKEGVEPEFNSNTTAISFTFKTGKEALVTRVIADETAGESQLNSVDIYAFDSSTGELVGKLVPGTDMTVTAGTGTINYAATPAWLRANSGKTLNFYFVGNDATSTSGAHMPATVPTTESAFVELITNQLADADTDGYYDNIATPLLFSTSAKNVQLIGKIQKDILLYRRVARFDIVNDHYTTFQVNKIMVSNAATKGYIFGDATGVNNPLPQGSLEEITGPAQSAYTVVDSEYLAPHAFYLYPTTVGLIANDAANTEIVINATIGGQTKNYIVPTTIDILANKRYKLVLDPVSLTFSIVAADWDEGDRIPMEEVPEPEQIALSNFASTGDGVFTESDMGDLNYEFTATAGNTLTFDAISENGSTYEIVEVDVAGGSPTTTMTVSKTALTRAAGTETYTVNAPAGSGSYRLLLVIKDSNGNPIKNISFTKQWGGYADILYLAEDGTLQVGQWGDELNKDNYQTKMMTVRGSGVVGVFPVPYSGTDALWDASLIRFNPTGTTFGYFKDLPINSDAIATSNGIPISDNDYHNLAAVKAGKGDVCRLIGMSVSQIAAMTTDEELYAAEQGWRLPTRTENVNFLGAGAEDITDASPYYAANGESFADPGTYQFPVLDKYTAQGSQVLPNVKTVSEYYTGSGFIPRPDNGGYYSSTVSRSSSSGIGCIIFGNGRIGSSYEAYSTNLNPIRCVRISQ